MFTYYYFVNDVICSDHYVADVSSDIQNKKTRPNKNKRVNFLIICCGGKKERKKKKTWLCCASPCRPPRTFFICAFQQHDSAVTCLPGRILRIYGKLRAFRLKPTFKSGSCGKGRSNGRPKKCRLSVKTSEHEITDRAGVFFGLLSLTGHQMWGGKRAIKEWI